MNVMDLVARLTLDNTQYLAGLGASEAKAKSFSNMAAGGLKKLGKVASVALGAATTAVTAFGASAIKTGMEFDKAMSQVYATMGDKADEMITDVSGTTKKASEVLRDFAQEMGATTQYTAAESAEALNYMALAGYDAATSMKMLPNVMNLASAGSFDLAKASDMLTDTQTALGWSLERTTQAVDEWAKAASTGNTSVEQLGEAFLTVGGLAKELNGGFVYLADGTEVAVDGTQELEIALTAMANAGIKGSEAGTHMRNMLLKLASPTSEGTKALEAMNVSVFDAEGNMRSLANIFVDLGNAMGTMTQEEKIQAISDLFNTRDIASAEALLAAVEQDWDGIGESILDADGAAEKMAETQLDNLAGDITKFKSALDGAKIALSDGLSPALRKFVQSGTEGLSTFTEKLKGGDLAGAAQAIGETLGKVATSLIGKLPQLVTAGMSLLKGVVSGLAEQLPTVLTQLYAQIVVSMNGLASTLSESLPTMIQNALQGLVGISANIRTMAGKFVEAGLNIVKSIADGIIQNIPTIIQTVPTIISNLAGIINDNMPKVIATGAQIIAKLVVGLVQAIPVLVASIPKILKAMWDVFLAFNWLNLGKQIITGIGKGISALQSTLSGALKRAGNSALNSLKGINWAGVGKSIISFISTAARAAGGMLKAALTALGRAALQAFKAIDWKSLGVNLVKGIIRGVTGMVGALGSAVANLVRSAFKRGQKAADVHSPSKLFMKGLGMPIGQGVALGIQKSTPWVEDAVNDMVNGALPRTIAVSTTGMSSGATTGNGFGTGDVFNFNFDYDASNDANDLLRDFARGVQRYRMAGAI